MTRLRNIWYTGRVTACFNAVCILLRFFKSFRSNPRLSVVTQTLSVPRAAVSA